MGHELTLAADRTALVLVDMQNDFCDPGGFYATAGRDITALRAVIPPARRLLERVRTAGMPVVFTRLLPDPERGPMQARHRLVPRHWTARERRLEPGTWGAQVVSELTPHPTELVVDKTGYSAFDGTPLERLLRERGVDTVLLAGVVGYACVLATGFAAFDRDFDVVLVTDAVGSWQAGPGEAAPAITDLLLGHAVTAEQLVIEATKHSGG